MSLTLTLNGRPRTFPELAEPANLSALVAELGVKEDRIALELNGQIVARGAWGETPIAQDDRLEMVHFVGGGVPNQV